MNKLHLNNAVDIKFNAFNVIFFCFIFPLAVNLSCHVPLRRSICVWGGVWDSCQSHVLLVTSLSNHAPNHITTYTRTYPTVCTKGLVVECQKTMLNCVEHFDCRKNDSLHQLPTAVPHSSNNMHHYCYWTRGRIKMGVLLITHCLCYPDWALFLLLICS